jgi:hypothetical protein
MKLLENLRTPRTLQLNWAHLELKIYAKGEELWRQARFDSVCFGHRILLPVDHVAGVARVAGLFGMCRRSFRVDGLG